LKRINRRVIPFVPTRKAGRSIHAGYDICYPQRGCSKERNDFRKTKFHRCYEFRFIRLRNLRRLGRVFGQRRQFEGTNFQPIDGGKLRPARSLGIAIIREDRGKRAGDLSS
jgi:hypothetical protein